MRPWMPESIARQNPCTAPIVLMSGSEFRLMAPTLGRSIGLHIAASLAKPFRVAELRLTLQQLRFMVQHPEPSSATGS